ncbi:MAG: hypothetical protein ACFFAU_01235 [Candidatus Hodarchaeota archaeon]
MRKLTAGNLVEVISTKKLAIVKAVDWHVITVEIVDTGREVMYTLDNLKPINRDVTINETDNQEVKDVKHRYVKWISGLPKNYKQDWTEEHIRIVANRLNGKNKEDRVYLTIKLGLELERTKGGIQWMYRRLFVKAGKGISVTERIKKVIEELGLLGG